MRARLKLAGLAALLRPGLGDRLTPRARHMVARPTELLRSGLGRWLALRMRLRVASAAAVLVLLIGGWVVLRDSSVFSVDQVSVAGLSSNALPAVSEQLQRAARAQTTTDFSLAALRSSVARYTLIDDLRAQTQFPNGLRIEVIERHPVAKVDVAGQWFYLAADGRVITGLARPGHLAVLRSLRYPWNGQARDPFVLLALRVLADAPAVLRHRVTSVTIIDGALSIQMRRGPRLIFGNGALPHAKWDAAAAVLADRSSRGASYIDLRLPSRPAAQVADAATISSASGASGPSVGTPATAATVATVLDPTMIGPSSSTSG